MEKKKFDTPFARKLLERVPISYRFMYANITEHIGELRMREKFSRSDKHRAEQYLNYPLAKPVSNFIIRKDNDK
jgi:hypothetical protein